MTIEQYTALPEIETAICPECGHVGFARGEVWVCISHEPPVMWRWPGIMGMD